jgi:PAS domain S-box-containing protein
MSEVINNREYRQQALKEIIKELHRGKSAAEVKEKFAELIQGVSATEISEMEQALMAEGMPVEEIQRLCDVHAAIFKGSIAEIHAPVQPDKIPGHPLHTFTLENRALERLVAENIRPHLEEYRKEDGREAGMRLLSDFNLLLDIEKHYSRKENLLFPFLEKYGVTAPPKVMWGVDDEIRGMIKRTRELLRTEQPDREHVVQQAEETLTKVAEMIFKEEQILFPMALDTLTEDEWRAITADSDAIGYSLVEPQGEWHPVRVNLEAKEAGAGEQPVRGGYLNLGTGILSPAEVKAIFNRLPVDITFVDRDGVVKYFNQAEERIFPRTRAVIGRTVQNCHPPASVQVVEKLVADLRSGEKEHEDFWIRMGDSLVYIRYFAVRDENGEFIGVLEVTQNIEPLQSISGEKRLLSGVET